MKIRWQGPGAVRTSVWKVKCVRVWALVGVCTRKGWPRAEAAPMRTLTQCMTIDVRALHEGRCLKGRGWKGGESKGRKRMEKTERRGVPPG